MTCQEQVRNESKSDKLEFKCLFRHWFIFFVLGDVFLFAFQKLNILNTWLKNIQAAQSSSDCEWLGNHSKSPPIAPATLSDCSTKYHSNNIENHCVLRTCFNGIWMLLDWRTFKVAAHRYSDVAWLPSQNNIQITLKMIVF